MLSTRIVIQKIEPESGSVRVFDNRDLRGPWSFETRRAISPSDSNPELFPFVFDGSAYFNSSRAGSETKLHIAGDGQLLFSDDYGVPSGIVIGLLFPETYVPEVLKFNSKPFIPVGVGLDGVSLQPPGHFDIYYNNVSRLAGIVFMPFRDTYFGFKCIAQARPGDFPKGGDHPFLSDLHATLGFEETHPVQISPEDLMPFQEVFDPSANIEELTEVINRLSAVATKADSPSRSELEKLSEQLKDTLSTSASIVQLSDSLLSGGTVSRLLAYLLL